MNYKNGFIIGIMCWMSTTMLWGAAEPLAASPAYSMSPSLRQYLKNMFDARMVFISPNDFAKTIQLLNSLRNEGIVDQIEETGMLRCWVSAFKRIVSTNRRCLSLSDYLAIAETFPRYSDLENDTQKKKSFRRYFNRKKISLTLPRPAEYLPTIQRTSPGPSLAGQTTDNPTHETLAPTNAREVDLSELVNLKVMVCTLHALIFKIDQIAGTLDWDGHYGHHYFISHEFVHRFNQSLAQAVKLQYPDALGEKIIPVMKSLSDCIDKLNVLIADLNGKQPVKKNIQQPVVLTSPSSRKRPSSNNTIMYENPRQKPRLGENP